MTRLVLGIIGIFALQLGFIAYQSIDRRFGMVHSAMGERTGEIVRVADISTPDSIIYPAPADWFESEVPPRLEKSAAIRRPAATAVAVHRTPRQRLRSLPDRSEAALFRPVIIRYGDGSSKDYKPDQPSPVEKLSRKEKRSFFAKAMPIVKKPYNWLKALGSALK
jgi:hypothetical protein